MTVLYGVLAIIGTILLAILYCMWFLKTAQKRIDEAAAKGIWYDERQVAAHGKAFEFAASVGGVYFLAAFVYFKLWEAGAIQLPVESSALMMGGLYLILISYHVCCLMTDSVLPLGEYHYPDVLCIICALVLRSGELIFGFVSDILFDMETDIDWCDVIMGFGFLSIGVIRMIARSRSKRDPE